MQGQALRLPTSIMMRSHVQRSATTLTGKPSSPSMAAGGKATAVTRLFGTSSHANPLIHQPTHGLAGQKRGRIVFRPAVVP